MKNNSIYSIIIILILLGYFIFSYGTAPVKGTYRCRDLYGNEQTIIISSNKETGPCIWRGERGRSTNESYIYYKMGVSDRPVLHIRGIAYIDIKNRKVYESLSDFNAYRNGRPCSITK